MPLIITDFRRSASAGAKFVSELALNIDIAPTILALAGIDRPKGMQGRELTALLAGEPVEGWRDDFLYEHLFEHSGIPKTEGVVGRRNKYMRYFRDADSFEQVFDIEHDPLEARNLVGTPGVRELVERLRARTRELVATSV